MNRQKTILAIGAHPDDIEFGCGGILLKEAAAGSRIHLVICSKGESGSNGSPDQRVAESTAAANILGASIEFLNLGGDAHIERTNPNALKIAMKIRDLKPDVVLSPTLVENQHPDHSVVGKLTRDAARLARYSGIEELLETPAHAIGSLLFYAITPGGEPENSAPFIFDVTSEVERWKELMACHASQMKTRNYMDLQLSRARTQGLQAGCSQAQALYSQDGIIVENLAMLSRSARQF